MTAGRLGGSCDRAQRLTGGNALEVKGIAADVEVRNNTFWAPSGMVHVSFAPDADRSNMKWDGNTYFENGKFSLDAWRKKTGFDKSSRLLKGNQGRPTGTHIHMRANRYEPNRVHLAVYNWDRKPAVEIDIGELARPGDGFRVVNVLDYYGEPVAMGKVAGRTIRLPMKGHRYEPGFGTYVLFLGTSGR